MDTSLFFGGAASEVRNDAGAMITTGASNSAQIEVPAVNDGTVSVTSGGEYRLRGGDSAGG